VAGEPLLQTGPAPALWQQMNAKPHLAEHNRIDNELDLVRSEPPDDHRIGHDSRRLAEDVRVDQVLHRVSVDSDGIGTKKSLPGQPSSQSTTPSLARPRRRTIRYSPRSIRSMSNCCPASMPSSLRSSAGRTSWPFEEIVVSTPVRYRLTPAIVKVRRP